MSAQLLHEVANGPRTLVLQHAVGVGVVHHADQTTAGRKQASAGRDCAAKIARCMQGTNCHDRIERAIGKWRRENIALDRFSGQPVLVQTMIDHGNRIGGDIEAGDQCAGLRELLRAVP